MINHNDYRYLTDSNVITKNNLPLTEEIFPKCVGLIGQRLEHNELPSNKGGNGVGLEKRLGLPQGSHACDFADGELKTATLNSTETGLKDDFRISSVWRDGYNEKKMGNMIVVTISQDGFIRGAYHLKILDDPKVKTVYDREFNKIKQIGLDKISQSDTNFFVAKTQNHSRSLYIARAFMSVLLGYEFKGRKGYETYQEVFC